MKKKNLKLPLINLSLKITQRMPYLIFKRIKQILKMEKIKRPKILIIGITYKKDTVDLRESPTIKLVKFLIKKKINISFYDPYIKEIKIKNKEIKRTNLNTISNFDLVIICVDHSLLDYDYIYSNSNIILDLKNTKVKTKLKGEIIYDI